MKLRELIVNELQVGGPATVPGLVIALRRRPDLPRLSRVYLALVWPALYVRMRRMEDEGTLESFRFSSDFDRQLWLTAWRIPGDRRPVYQGQSA